MSSLRLISALTAGLLTAGASSLLAQNAYMQTDLVCDPTYYQLEGFTPQNQPNIIQDPNLIDAWGISVRPAGAGGHFWLANAMTGYSDEFLGDVNGVPLHQDGLTSVPLDTPRFTDHGYAFVTGVVYNSASDTAGQPEEFPVSGAARNATTGASLGTVSGASKFVFVTQDGCVNAWLSNTATAMYTSPIIVDYSKTAMSLPYATNCVFTGVAMTQNASITAAYSNNGLGRSGNLLFAADQRNNVIEVFDNTWKDVTTSFPAFQTPADVAGLHVFNIQDLAGHLYVTYAEFNPAGDEGQEQTEGAGLGKLVEYNEDGSLVMDFKDGANTPTGVLDEPWGVAIAPSTFGAFSGDVLVANFGDGTVAAFDPATGTFVGDLKDTSGNTISVDGIWGLTFGNGVSLGDANSLYFSSGPNSEYDGLFGKLTVVSTPTDTPALPSWALTVFGLGLLLVASRHLRRT